MNTDLTPADILAAPDAEIEVALRDAPHEVAAHIWQAGLTPFGWSALARRLSDDCPQGP